MDVDGSAFCGSGDGLGDWGEGGGRSPWYLFIKGRGHRLVAGDHTWWLLGEERVYCYDCAARGGMLCPFRIVLLSLS